MAFNIGINVIETDGSAAPEIAGAPTSVAGLILRSRRGPIDRAVRVSNFRQFGSRFGGYDRRFVGTYCVDGFFLNDGREAYVVRVINSQDVQAGTAKAASVTLKDRKGNNTISVSAGYRGTEDIGDWGNDLSVTIKDNPEFSTRLVATLEGNQPARLQGVAMQVVDLSPVGGTLPRSLSLKLDGEVTPFNISFDRLPVPRKSTAEDVVAVINAELEKNPERGQQVTAIVKNNGILLISRSKGASSKIEIVESTDDTPIKLGFIETNRTALGEVGDNSYTQVRVESQAGFKIGEWVRLDDGITENWHQITEIPQPQDDGTGKLQYFLRWAAPDATERNEYRLEDGAKLTSTEFDLIVTMKANGDPKPQVVETWNKLTLNPSNSNYAPLRLNDAFSGSSYLKLEDLNPGAFNGSDLPALVRSIKLQAGNDGSPPTARDYIAALARFDTIDIQLLAVPEIVDEENEDGILKTITLNARDYCDRRGDCLFVGHTPPKRDVEAAKTFGQNFRSSKTYGALYWPWITVTDPAGVGANPTRIVPPTGHILGIYARIDLTRGVWKAPAGNEAVVRGALAVERDITDVDHTDLVKNGSVNGVRSIRGAGIVLDASRTLSTDTRWLYINVRLLFNYVKASLREGLRWVKQEPNRDSLWNKIKYNVVTPFLLRLHQEGAFGTGTPAQVFTVICGPENNPPSEVDLGNLKLEVYFYPGKPAETIVIVVGQQESGASASER
jgi:Phage tail sheath protein subtilisin-like domain